MFPLLRCILPFFIMIIITGTVHSSVITIENAVPDSRSTYAQYDVMIVHVDGCIIER